MIKLLVLMLLTGIVWLILSFVTPDDQGTFLIISQIWLASVSITAVRLWP